MQDTHLSMAYQKYDLRTIILVTKHLWGTLNFLTLTRLFKYSKDLK